LSNVGYISKLNLEEIPSVRYVLKPSLRKKLISLNWSKYRTFSVNTYRFVWLEVCANKRRKKYFITFIDDCTRYCYVYPL